MSLGLLPRDHQQFRKKEYWDHFFRRRGKAAFEWYGEYGQLCSLLHKYIKVNDRILVVGCGNSTLSADLFDVGFKQMVNIDISDVVIAQMRQSRPEMTFEKMDVTDMTGFTDQSFTCVLDKGTLDAIFTDDQRDDVIRTVDKMFQLYLVDIKEIDRILKVGGRYICISLLQPHILSHVVHTFQLLGWPLRIVRCREAEEGRPPEDRMFPVFAIVATKFRQTNIKIQILEMSLSPEGQMIRLPSANDLISSIRGIQQFAAVRAASARSKMFKKSFPEEDVCLDLRTPDSDCPRFSLYLVDREKPGASIKFAVFIVPQGRETEWLFSTSEGRRQLCESADCMRLVVVHLHRHHNYDSLQAVQDELSPVVMDLAPASLDSKVSVPFLSAGAESVGRRIEQSRGKSEFSGEFIVEDVEVNGDFFRRLIFFSNPNLTQSEAKLHTVKTKKKKTRLEVDPSYLACTHHAIMVAALGQHITEPIVRCLIVGLGGGSLATFISSHFLQTDIDVVELDPAIARIAAEQFAFRTSDKLRLVLQDGLKYIEEFDGSQSSKRYHFIMFDVDSKDTTVGMSCPPAPFVEMEFLERMRKNCLHHNGFFILNLVCRDTSLRQEIFKRLRNVFPNVFTYKIPEEVNEIVFCGLQPWEDGKPKIDKKHPFIKGIQVVNGHLRERKNSNDGDFLGITEALKCLRLVDV